MMKWLRYLLLISLLLFGIYTIVVYYGTEESESFTIEKEIPFPIEKVYPQFSNFQNFTLWNEYFAEENQYQINYFSPYEGEGSSISFRKPKDPTAGEMYIRYESPNKQGIKYQLFQAGDNQPFVINLKFVSIGAEKTKVIWNINTPKLPFFQRHQYLWLEDDFEKSISKSFANLTYILTNKIDRDQHLSTIKYDSIIVENMEETIVLGVHSSSVNKKDKLYQHIIKDYNKVMNYTRVDLAKREDEIGYPIILSKSENLSKTKSMSYFIGLPLSQKIEVKDQNFSFQTLKPNKTYNIYYKGKFENRQGSIQKLLQKVRKDTLQHGDVIQTFIKIPQEDKDVIMKISVPVHR